MGAVARLRRGGRLRNFYFSFFKADEGVTHSLDYFVDMLIECEVHEYRCSIVDADVNRVLPREVAQAGNGSDDTRFTEFGQGCRQGAAWGWTRFICAFQGRRILSTTGNLPSMHVLSGDTSGTNHRTDVLSTGKLRSTPVSYR